MKVYKINLKVDEFRSLLAKDDSVHDRRLLAMDGSSKAQEWTEPLEAVFDNEEAAVPDIYSCGAGNLLLWGRSLEILGPIAVPIAELLPVFVFWDAGEGFLVNLIGFSDCLDLEETNWYVHEGSGKRLAIEQHAFVADKIPKFVPFKIEAQRFATFCADHEDGSESLPSLLDKHGLTGVNIETVWNY